jgi:6-phosphogluconolactonase
MVNKTGQKSYSIRSYPGKEVLVFDQPEHLLDFLIHTWNAIAEEAVAERGFFSVALSGGSTPVKFYRKLAHAESLPWDKTHIFIVDERFVPFDHRDSNYCMINETLLSNINIPHQNIHPVVTTHKSARDSAAGYERKIISFFHLTEGEAPAFDLILLGIGEDGHTASLFPGEDALQEKRHLAVNVAPSESHNHERITLTIPVINNARNIMFMVTGDSKAEVIMEILDKRESALPAVFVSPDHGSLYFLLDKEAASRLSIKN